MKKLLAIDTEDDSQGTPSIINFFDGESHTTFTGRSCMADARSWLVTQAPAQVWACNAEYDLINLYGPWLGKLVTLQYVRSGLLRASVREAAITFYDTYRHWPRTVAEMGEYLGLPKGTRDFQSVEYCQRDTEIVWRFVQEMMRRYEDLGLRMKATLPSMALQLFQQFYPQEFIRLPGRCLTFFRRGYYGGRVEVYRFHKIWGRTYHYDVNSLFPSVMASERYPRLDTWYAAKSPRWDREGMAWCRVYVAPHSLPPLPVRGAQDMLYPYGVVEGVWCYPEMRQMLRDGGEVLSIYHAIEFSQTERPFASYVNFCYQKRREARMPLDAVLWKLMMNSLYGKFGQGEGLEVIYKDHLYTLETAPPAHVNVVWSAYVTCYARLRLLAFLRRCSEVYYTDTDSVFTPDVLPVSDKLGKLKQEGVYTKGWIRDPDTGKRVWRPAAEFIGNKIYVVGDLAKAKGVPRGVAKDFIRLGRAVFRRPARFRESRRSFAQANVWYEATKELKTEYTKRKILANGRTEPWDYADYVKRFM